MSDLANDCREAFCHGPADAAGRCPWCGSKYTHTMARPDRHEPSNLSESYQQFYDPDYGALSPAEVEHRYLMGLYS